MSLPLVIRRAARADFDEAFDWYERQRPGLGLEFADRVQAVFDSIAAMPELRAPVHHDVRLALVKPFPYSVVYSSDGRLTAARENRAARGSSS